jgi:hypothetical protein
MASDHPTNKSNLQRNSVKVSWVWMNLAKLKVEM